MSTLLIMKKVIVLTSTIFFTFYSFAQKMQDKNVPANLKSTFNQKYPEATAVKWDKEEKMYEASFKLKNIDNSVLMDTNGNIVETEVKTDLEKIPKVILTYVKNKYAAKKPNGAATITDSKGKITYEVEMKGIDLIFDDKGNFIKKVKA